MLKLLRRKSSFRRSKDFKKGGSGGGSSGEYGSAADARHGGVGGGGGSRRRSSVGGGGSGSTSGSVDFKRNYSHDNSVGGGGGHYRQRNSEHHLQVPSASGGGGDSRFSSWDRRSQSSASGGHRYYSINTLGEGPSGVGGSGRDSPPQILQYARPPENLTSPNRESSSALPLDSLTHSPSLEKRVAKERKRLEAEQQRNKSAVPKRGDGVISSIRQSFKRKGRKTSEPARLGPTSPVSDGPPSIHLPARKLSSASAAGRYTPTGSDLVPVPPSSTSSSRRSGSVSSFKATQSGKPLLLPGRAASPGKPVQVVAPFQQAEAKIPEEGEDKTMRDPTLLVTNATSSNNNHNNNSDMNATATAPQPAARQQRCLPQTPKSQSSRAALAAATAAAAAAASKPKSVVSPVQHHAESSSSHRSSSAHHHHHSHHSSSSAAGASSTSSAPRPAQRLSLRHKVGFSDSEQPGLIQFVRICERARLRKQGSRCTYLPTYYHFLMRREGGAHAWAHRYREGGGASTCEFVLRSINQSCMRSES